MSQEVARGRSFAKAVFHVHVTIVVAHGIPVIDVPLLPLADLGKSLPLGVSEFPGDVSKQNPTLVHPMLGIL